MQNKKRKKKRSVLVLTAGGDLKKNEKENRVKTSTWFFMCHHETIGQCEIRQF